MDGLQLLNYFLTIIPHFKNIKLKFIAKTSNHFSFYFSVKASIKNNSFLTLLKAVSKCYLLQAMKLVPSFKIIQNVNFSRMRVTLTIQQFSQCCALTVELVTLKNLTESVRNLGGSKGNGAVIIMFIPSPFFRLLILKIKNLCYVHLLQMLNDKNVENRTKSFITWLEYSPNQIKQHKRASYSH